MRFRLLPLVLGACVAILHGCTSPERPDLDAMRHRVARVAGPPGTATGAGIILGEDRLLVSNHVLARVRGSPWLSVEGVPMDFQLVEAGRNPDEFVAVESGPAERLCDLAGDWAILEVPCGPLILRDLEPLRFGHAAPRDKVLILSSNERTTMPRVIHGRVVLAVDATGSPLRCQRDVFVVHPDHAVDNDPRHGDIWSGGAVLRQESDGTYALVGITSALIGSSKDAATIHQFVAARIPDFTKQP